MDFQMVFVQDVQLVIIHLLEAQLLAKNVKQEQSQQQDQENVVHVQQVLTHLKEVHLVYSVQVGLMLLQDQEVVQRVHQHVRQIVFKQQVYVKDVLQDMDIQVVNVQIVQLDIIREVEHQFVKLVKLVVIQLHHYLQVVFNVQQEHIKDQLVKLLV